MSDKNNFSDVQRLNSAIMAKCAWTSSLIGMRKTGEEIHHRRTNTHRKANAFLQDLLEQRADGSSIDDNGVTDRYHRFLRTKSHLNDDGHVLGEFDRRLQALNANRMAKGLKPTDEEFDNRYSLPGRHWKESSVDQNLKLRPRSSSKSTLNSNALTSFFSSVSQGNISYHVEEHRSSSASSEESPSSSISRSTAKALPKSKGRLKGDSKETKELALGSSNRDMNRRQVQHMDDSSPLNEVSISSSDRTATEQSVQPNARQVDAGADIRESTSTVLKHVVVKPPVEHVSNEERTEGSSTSLSDRSTAAEISRKPNTRRFDRNEGHQESATPSMNQTVAKAHIQHKGDDQHIETPSTSSSDRSTEENVAMSKARQVNDSEEVFSLQRSAIPTFHKLSARQTDARERAEQSMLATSTSSKTKILPQHPADNQSIKTPSTSTAKRSIKKPSQRTSERQVGDSEPVEKASTKILPKPQLRQTDAMENVTESSVSTSTTAPATKTLYRPVARRPDGSELIPASTESLDRHTASDGSLFNQRFLPRSLVSREPITIETKSNIVPSTLPTKQYDNTQLRYLLDSIETECSPVNFTVMLDQLNLSSAQLLQSESNISPDDSSDGFNGEDTDTITLTFNLFDESPCSQDYYTTFTVHIDDPRKISLYTMTIGIVQLTPSSIMPYSILVGHRPLLQRSQETDFRRVRSRQDKQTYQLTAIEAFTHMEQVQTNDMIVKINDQPVWNCPLDAVRSILKEYCRPGNVCSLTIARLCQPFI